MLNAERRIELVTMLKAGKTVREISRDLHCESSEIAQVRRELGLVASRRPQKNRGRDAWHRAV